jgi:3-methyl-2-oxobutanoate hydroxymethyltransferase
MSHQPAALPPRSGRIRIPEITAAKGQRKLVVLTAYTAPMAGLLDAHCDMLMVGDSLGMVVYGYDSTLPVTLDLMIAHGAAVVRGSRHACVVIDLPFGSYQASPEQALMAAARVLKETGAACVKLEGGAEMADTVRFLATRGVPVMAHIGLMPQHMHCVGGFKTQGKDLRSQRALLADAKALEEAGAFALLIEGVVEPLAAEITRAARIPTIGIGASPACDGQVLVVDDMLGMFERSPRFVKQFATLRQTIDEAASAYAREVRAGSFPAANHCYGIAEAPAGARRNKKK